MKHFFLSIALLSLTTFLHAQGEANNWVFGDRAGVSWNTGVPVAFSGSVMVQQEGPACISDKAGNLLFYTSGVQVWNRLHQQMPNGLGLMGDNSTSQSAVIVPWPGDTTKYFVFTVAAQAGTAGFRYSVINMSLQGGLGDVEVASKNTLLYTPTCEKVTAVKHANGTDYWVVSHQWNNNSFNAYLVTSAGLNPVPVISPVGAVHTESVGYMKFSHDGQMLAVAANYGGGFVEVLNFNNATGQLINAFFHEANTTSSQGPYGVEFSPSNRYLYIAYAPYTGPLLQYDIQAGSSAAILASKYVIAPSTDQSPLQLAVDGKIYISRYQQNFLSVINTPDMPGAACGYQTTGVLLTAGTFARYGLPNFMQSYFFQNGFTFQNMCLGEATAFTISSADVDSARWDFGDAASGAANVSLLLNPSHVFSRADTFDVTLISWNNNQVDTTTQQVVVQPLPVVSLGNDTTLCAGKTLQLNATAANGIYLWQNNSIASTLAVTQNGTYWVEVTVANCASADTIQVNFLPAMNISLGADTALCSPDTLNLDATTTGATYHWQDNTAAPVYTVSQTGTYYVTVTDNNGCTAESNHVAVTISPVPVVNLGSDTTLCSPGTLKLDATTAGAIYHWQDNTAAPVYTVSQTGTYYVTVTDNNGCTAESNHVAVTISSVPVVNLGGDTTLCNGQTLQLDAAVANGSYVWQNNSNASAQAVTQSGTYWVAVTVANCASADTIQVNFTTLNINLGTDTAFCAPHTLTLNATTAGATYHWQDNTAAPVYTVSQTGIYSVTVSMGNGCVAHDTVSVNIFQIANAQISSTRLIFCSGDSTKICALPGFTAYQWNTGVHDTCVSAKLAGNYYVTVTDNNGCTAESNHVAISVYPLPPVSITVNGDTLNAYNASTYQWFLNGSPISGATSGTYIAKQGGSYTVAITDANGCHAVSSPIAITGIDNLLQDEIYIYPNPANSRLNIQIFETLIGAQLNIYDVTGSLLQMAVFQTQNLTLNTSNLPAGVYIAEIKLNGAVARKKWVKM